MARIRKTEPVLAVSAAAAAPARRKTPPATKKAAAGSREASTAAAIEPESTTVKSSAVRYSPTQEEIAALAYSYYATRGYFGGSPEEDWLRAEQELYQRTPALA
jgi:hypothetical protein